MEKVLILYLTINSFSSSKSQSEAILSLHRSSEMYSIKFLIKFQAFNHWISRFRATILKLHQTFIECPVNRSKYFHQKQLAQLSSHHKDKTQLIRTEHAIQVLIVCQTLSLKTNRYQQAKASFSKMKLMTMLHRYQEVARILL